MSRYIYESKQVHSSRKEKSCDVCLKLIDKGKPSITITCFDSEFYAVYVCSDKCEKKFRKNYNEEK